MKPLILLLFSLFSANLKADTCAPLGMSQGELIEVSSQGFSAISLDQTPDFLLGIVSCLSSTDPFLRDAIAYEGTMTLLRREEALNEATISALEQLKPKLISTLDDKDPYGVTRPFAIILLGEVARTDRIKPWMRSDEKLELVALATQYMKGLDDYRAFDDQVGFRHGVAHGADLILQLSLNQNIEANALLPLVAAIKSKIDPDGTVYTTGEPGRLVRALLYLAQRAGSSTALQSDILALMESIKDPAPYENWSTVFKSEQGLAFRHNRRAFAESLYAQFNPHAEHQLVKPYINTITESLRAIP